MKIVFYSYPSSIHRANVFSSLFRSRASHFKRISSNLRSQLLHSITLSRITDLSLPRLEEFPSRPFLSFCSSHPRFLPCTASFFPPSLPPFAYDMHAHTRASARRVQGPSIDSGHSGIRVNCTRAAALSFTDSASGHRPADLSALVSLHAWPRVPTCTINRRLVEGDARQYNKAWMDGWSMDFHRRGGLLVMLIRSRDQLFQKWIIRG